MLQRTRRGMKRLLNRALSIVRPIQPRPQYSDWWTTDRVGIMDSYRQNEEAIVKGHVPLRYTRIAAYIPGTRVAEVGCGEGVLALLLGLRGLDVAAFDINEQRLGIARNLQKAWLRLNRPVHTVSFRMEDTVAQPQLLDGYETLVTARILYHLQQQATKWIEDLPESVNNLVMVGNADKASLYNSSRGDPSHSLGKWLALATTRGMVDLAERHGFRVIVVDEMDDPLVVATRSSENRSTRGMHER